VRACAGTSIQSLSTLHTLHTTPQRKGECGTTRTSRVGARPRDAGRARRGPCEYAHHQSGPKPDSSPSSPASGPPASSDFRVCQSLLLHCTFNLYLRSMDCACTRSVSRAQRGLLLWGIKCKRVAATSTRGVGVRPSYAGRARRGPCQQAPVSDSASVSFALDPSFIRRRPGDMSSSRKRIFAPLSSHLAYGDVV
jgi:hypothetical protein